MEILGYRYKWSTKWWVGSTVDPSLTARLQKIVKLTCQCKHCHSSDVEYTSKAFIFYQSDDKKLRLCYIECGAGEEREYK